MLRALIHRLGNWSRNIAAGSTLLKSIRPTPPFRFRAGSRAWAPGLRPQVPFSCALSGLRGIQVVEKARLQLGGHAAGDASVGPAIDAVEQGGMPLAEKLERL